MLCFPIRWLSDWKSSTLPFIRNQDLKQCAGVVLWQPSQPHPPVWLGEWKGNGSGKRAGEHLPCLKIEPNHPPRQVAGLVGADPKEIIWTSGATESNNIAVKGVGRFYKGKKKHVVTTQTEHKCVILYSPAGSSLTFQLKRNLMIWCMSHNNTHCTCSLTEYYI